MATNNDQAAKACIGKRQLVPPQIIKEGAEAKMYGNRKHKNPGNNMSVDGRRHIVARDLNSVAAELGSTQRFFIKNGASL